jgi:hypothetical protein
MKNEPMTRRAPRAAPPLWAWAVAATLATATVVGCSDTSRQNAEETARSAVSAAEDDIRSAVTDVVDNADEAARNAGELAARNFASIQGEEEFDAAGHPIADNLTCTAEVQESMTEIAIECSGTTEDGGAAELTGTTSELPGASVTELKGSFTGTVDGAEVFSTDQLGG